MEPPPPSPRPTSTIRRNPPRRAKQIHSTIPSFPLPLQEEQLKNPLPPPPPPLENNNLKVFLRIRPLQIQPKPTRNPKTRGGIKNKNKKTTGGLCLVVNDSTSVTVSAPTGLLDGKRSKTEVYDGFTHVFPMESIQEEVYEKIMGPLVMDFMEGKSVLLAAMGPTGSGKTHTMFGSPREPGMVPLALRQILVNASENEEPQQPRSYYLSMFEINSERGKVERILDLSPNGVDLSLQQSSIKGLQEVMISNAADAESLVACGLLKRATAATSANNQSSRSQCIINIRSTWKNVEGESNLPPYSAVLTIADLAGAERERKTGNQGSRLLESNFINNTSMVFGLCLRSLLEHQKNPRKSFEKHFKNSLLTRYLREYLEGKKRMTLILTAKPGEDDYFDTSFLLRQASPYMKIKFNNHEEIPNLPPQKRNTSSFIRVEHHKRRKFSDSEASTVDNGKSEKNVIGDRQISQKDSDHEIGPQQISNGSSKSLRTCHLSVEQSDSFHVELSSMNRNYEVMTNFAKAFWNVLKQYKEKLKESENEVQSLKETLGKEMSQVKELKKELEELRSHCSCHNNPSLGVLPRPDRDAVPRIPHLNCDNFKKVEEIPANLSPVTACQIPETAVTVYDPEVLGFRGILLNKNVTVDTKRAWGSSVQRSTPIVESQKLVGETSTSFAVAEHVQEGVESIKNTGNKKISSNIDSIDTFADKSDSRNGSLVSTTIYYSPAGKCNLLEEDKKLEFSAVPDSSNRVGEINKQSHEECKSFLGNDQNHEDLLEADNLRATEMSSSATARDCECSDSLDTSAQSCREVEDNRTLSSNRCSTILEEKAEVVNAASDVLYVKEDVMYENHEFPCQDLERFQVVKQSPQYLEVTKDQRVKFSDNESSAVHASHSHDLEDGEGVPPIPEKALHVEEIKQPALTENGEHDPITKLEYSGKPRRKLLPASTMLLKQFSGLDMEAENAKESRGRPATERAGRSQGSLSLLHLLKSNLHQ